MAEKDCTTCDGKGERFDEYYGRVIGCEDCMGRGKIDDGYGETPAEQFAVTGSLAESVHRARRLARPPRKALLTFAEEARENRRAVFQAEPQIIFRPMGLMLWEVPPDADVTEIRVGNCPQLTVTWGPIPARWFAMAKSYEEVVRLVTEEGIAPPSWGDFDVLSLGMLCRVVIETRANVLPTDFKLLMWGWALDR